MSLNRSSLSFKAETSERKSLRETSVETRSFVEKETIARSFPTRDEAESFNRARADHKQRKLERDRLLKSRMQTGELTFNNLELLSGCKGQAANTRLIPEANGFAPESWSKRSG
jgi:hypothetical protein